MVSTFVAIDEGNQPLKGAMKTWGITAETMSVRADAWSSHVVCTL